MERVLYGDGGVYRVDESVLAPECLDLKFAETRAIEVADGNLGPLKREELSPRSALDVKSGAYTEDDFGRAPFRSARYARRGKDEEAVYDGMR